LIARLFNRRNSTVPIYALDGESPDLPAAGQFWIAPDAHIIGSVRLRIDVGIWFGTVLHGDNELTEVGSRSNVQEGAMLHTDTGFPMATDAGSATDRSSGCAKLYTRNTRPFCSS
jgi:carbonic anhydrase/acetyltransferase-like protein (isoleucine patch superfamily)